MENKDRYTMEYINSEVSTITDETEQHELTAEEIVDRLNDYERKINGGMKHD